MAGVRQHPDHRAILKITGGTVLPIVVSLLLNEVRSSLFRRSVQTIIYFPYFISWIVFGGIMVDLLSPNGGIVNQVIVALGFEPVYFLGRDRSLFHATAGFRNRPMRASTPAAGEVVVARLQSGQLALLNHPTGSERGRSSFRYSWSVDL